MEGEEIVKYLIVIPDGMADEPIAALGNKTPLEAANTPVMDTLASQGTMGTVSNVPVGLKPGSDVANLSVVGYDPARVYSGRSPLEALSVGVPMADTDVSFRCNIVTLSEDEPFENKIIVDHSSGEISTEDADVLMDAVRKAFSSETLQFYTGTSYRHVTIWKSGAVLPMEPPHDHLGQPCGPFLPENAMFREIMKKSYEILNTHPLNLERAAKGKNKANCLWFWGAGTKPALESFKEKYGLTAAMISAVDLLKGIAVGAGMQVYEVAGANGSLETNYAGKTQAALDALLKDGMDLACIHIEAPDEMGHQGNLSNKIKSIEYVDGKILTPVLKGLYQSGEDFRLLVLPDHPTPIRCRTHTSDPVPYVLFDSRSSKTGNKQFTEANAAACNNYLPDGSRLMEKLIDNGGNE